MTTIRHKIKEASRKRAGDISVKDVRIGMGYTAVLLENGQAGVAYTFRKDFKRGCNLLEGVHPLTGKRADELLEMLDSVNTIESAVALATSNALSNISNKNQMEGDVLNHISLNSTDHVAMVGHFAPLVPALKKKVSSLKIFEQIDKPKNGLLPERELPNHLPHCQVAFITSTSIINNTIDNVLKAARSCREVSLLGASTPMMPEIFEDTSATLLSGIIVTEPEEILRIVSEGGGMRRFKDHIRKVNVRLEKTESLL